MRTWQKASELMSHKIVEIDTADGQNPALPIIRNIPEFP